MYQFSYTSFDETSWIPVFWRHAHTEYEFQRNAKSPLQEIHTQLVIWQNAFKHGVNKITFAYAYENHILIMTIHTIKFDAQFIDSVWMFVIVQPHPETA